MPPSPRYRSNPSRIFVVRDILVTADTRQWIVVAKVFSLSARNPSLGHWRRTML